MRRFPIFLAAFVGVFAAGALTSEPGPMETVSACLISDEAVHPITIEIARTPAQRQQGLMHRRFLPPDRGMLFVYDDRRGPDHSFWMHDTLIPLDIAFLDSQGHIRRIRQMEPCPQRGGDCKSYQAGTHFRAALEMNAGWFEENGISKGDHVQLAGPLQRDILAHPKRSCEDEKG